MKTLIRLGGHPGWYESSLGAQSFCWFCHEAVHFSKKWSNTHLELSSVTINEQIMTKPTKWCANSKDLDQPAHPLSLISHRCPHEESLGYLLSLVCAVNTLIRLGGCPGGSESSLGTQVILLFLLCCGSNVFTYSLFNKKYTPYVCGSWAHAMFVDATSFA